MVYVVYCVASGKQEKVQACLVTLWLFIILRHSLYKTTLGYAHENLHDLLKASTFNVLEILCENVYLCGYPNLLVVTQI